MLNVSSALFCGIAVRVEKRKTVREAFYILNNQQNAQKPVM
jgi:hypothetical protein